jgi:hypothetical protein
MAKFFPSDLPPTVKAAISATMNVLAKVPPSPAERLFKLKIMATPTAPLSVPATSPMRSLHTVETESALRTSQMACFAPGTLFEAMAWKGASSPAVADTPTISKITPTKIIKSSNTKPNVNGTNDNTLLLPKFKANDTKNVAMVNVNTFFQRTSMSSLGTSFCVCTEVNGSEVGKDCGLGPAGFPKGRPVRHRNWRFPFATPSLVTICEAGLPLSPHCNPHSTISREKQSRSFPQHQSRFSSLFCSEGFKGVPLCQTKGPAKAPWPGALCCKPLSPKHHSRQATLHPTLMYD